MATPFNATTEEIVGVLRYFWPGMIYTLYGLNYEDLIVHPESPVPKPTLAEMQSHYAEARQLIAAARAQALKESRFQEQYPPQTQMITLIQAIYDPATTSLATLKSNTALTAMKNAYQNA